MEYSEPERAAARFQAVVSSLLAPGRGAQLFLHNPLEVRLQVGADTQRGVPVLAQVLLTRGDDAAGLKARLQPLLDRLVQTRTGGEDERFHLRIIVVTTPEEAAWVDTTLRLVCQDAPAAPVLQAFQISSDGKVRSASSLLFSEVGPALREQAKLSLQLMPAAEFAVLCERALGQTQVNEGEVRELAQVVQGRRPVVTYGLLGLNLLLFGLGYLWGNPGEPATQARMGAAAPQWIVAGEWWRLLAATALHGGIVHICFNSFGLWNLGRLLEPILGSARFLTLYVVSGLGGSLLLTALGILNGFQTSVGASGAICGLLGACAEIGLRPRGDLPDPVAQNLKRMALLNLGITAVISLQPHIDWRAHLGGALAGAALTFLGLVRPTVRAVENASSWRSIFHGGLAVLCAGFMLLSIGTALRKGQPWLLSHPEQRQRIAPVGMPLSLEVPRALGGGQSGSGGEGSTSWIFDDQFISPLVLKIIAEPFPDPAKREYFAQTGWQQTIKNFQEAKPPFTVRELTLSGLPTLAISRTGESGEQDRRLFQLRHNYQVELTLEAPPGASDRMMPSLEELLTTIQDEPR